MRLEKGFLHWKAELITEFDPFETGLDRFVKLEKGAFIGREALMARQAAGPRKRLVTLEIDSTDAPAHSGASLMRAGRVVGTVTSGDRGYRTGLNLAFAFVAPDCAAPGSVLQADLCGEIVAARVITPSPYDPEHSRMRG